MAQFLDETGLKSLWTKIKNTFILKSHTYDDYLPLTGGTLTGTLNTDSYEEKKIQQLSM